MFFSGREYTSTYRTNDIQRNVIVKQTHEGVCALGEQVDYGQDEAEQAYLASCMEVASIVRGNPRRLDILDQFIISINLKEVSSQSRLGTVMMLKKASGCRMKRCFGMIMEAL